jgi:hypothetical protein
MTELDKAYFLVSRAMDNLGNMDVETYLMLEEALGYIAEANEEIDHVR